MPLYGNSRYVKVGMLQIEDSAGEGAEVYKLRSTTVLPVDLPDDWQSVVVQPGETFEYLAERIWSELGGAELWWVLADCNPEIMYPLDVAAGDVIRVPSASWVAEYMRTEDLPYG